MNIKTRDGKKPTKDIIEKLENICSNRTESDCNIQDENINLTYFYDCQEKSLEDINTDEKKVNYMILKKK